MQTQPTKYNKAHFIIMVLQNRMIAPEEGTLHTFDAAVKRLARKPAAEVQAQYKMALNAAESVGRFDI